MKKIVFILTVVMGATALGFEEVSKTFQTFDKLTFKGKLTYPDNVTGKKVGVLLIHGSGPMDMNLWLPGSVSANKKSHKAFEAIAQNLAENGIVSFRYNKRGITDKAAGSPIVDQKLYESITYETLVKDAVSAFKVLKDAANVDVDRLLVLGISQGTLIAPQVAKSTKSVAGLVLMASIGSNDNDSIVGGLKLPTLLLHGEIDSVTSLSEAKDIAKALAATGTAYEFITYPNLGHGFSPNAGKNGTTPTLGPIEPDVISAIPEWINKTF